MHYIYTRLYVRRCALLVRCALNVFVNMHTTFSALYFRFALLVRCALNAVCMLHTTLPCCTPHYTSQCTPYGTPHVVNMHTTSSAHLTCSALNVVCILHTTFSAHLTYVVCHMCFCRYGACMHARAHLQYSQGNPIRLLVKVDHPQTLNPRP